MVDAGVTRADLATPGGVTPPTGEGVTSGGEAPGGDVTPRRCSECDADISHRSPQASTCGASCRKARSRRLKREAAEPEAADVGAKLGTLYALADGANGPVRLTWRPPERPFVQERMETRLGVPLDLVVELECTMDQFLHVMKTAPRIGEEAWYDNGPELRELLAELRPEPEVPAFDDAGVCRFGGRTYTLTEAAEGSGFYQLTCDGHTRSSRSGRCGRPATPREAIGWARSVVLSGWPKEVA